MTTCKQCRCRGHRQSLASQHNPAERDTDDAQRVNRRQFRSEDGRNLRPRHLLFDLWVWQDVKTENCCEAGPCCWRRAVLEMFGARAKCEMHGVSLEDQIDDTHTQRYEAAAIGDGNSEAQFSELEDAYAHFGPRHPTLVFWSPKSMW